MCIRLETFMICYTLCCRLIFRFIAYKNIANSICFLRQVLDSLFPNRISVNITVFFNSLHHLSTLSVYDANRDFKETLNV